MNRKGIREIFNKVYDELVIADYDSQTIRQISLETGLTWRTVKKVLLTLQDLDVVCSEKNGKRKYWRLTDKLLATL